MFDLLQEVRFSIRCKQFRDSCFLIDRRVVEIVVEHLIGERQLVDGLRLRLDAQVIVSGIVPTADIQSGHMFTRSKRGER